jgi:ABC-type glycerol-3-phosphate transport system substrate-binding protein
VPQTIDGLVVVRDRSRPAPSSPAIDDLVSAARAAKRDGYPLGLRVDGYWLVPWLRAEGVELAPTGGIDGDGAVKAMAKFAALFGDVSAPPPPAGSETPDELKRWSSGELAYWVTGPWALGALRDRDRLAVSALAHAPRGGQLLVVPKCAKRPAEGWRLATELTDVGVLARFADTFGTVPTRKSALAAAPQLARDLYAALTAAEPLRRDARTPLLFDDLNPALGAVIAHDATPDEAIAGVRRGWQRLAKGSASVP